MCWVSWINKESADIASKDILVYKLVKSYAPVSLEKVKSLYQDYVYDIGKTYTDESTKIQYCYKEISRAFHSYSLEHTSLLYDYHFISVRSKTNCIYLDCVRKLGKMFALCVIPKGSYYRENQCGEIVSDKIRIVEVFDVDVDRKKISKIIPIVVLPT